MRRAGPRAARALAGKVLAAALVTPVVLAAGFIVAVEGVATGRAFRLLALADRVLPADPALGALMVAAGALGCLGALGWAVLRWPRLFPMLLMAAGGAAEARVLGAAGWWEFGDWTVPACGAAGLALAGRLLARGPAETIETR